MKKLSLALVLIALTLCLNSCTYFNEIIDNIVSTTEPSVSTMEESTTNLVEEETPFVLFDKNAMSPAELDKIIVEQGNRHGLNRFCYDGSWIYGVWFNNGYSEVVKVRYDGSEWTVLDASKNEYLENCVALHNGYLYFLRSTGDYNDELVRVRVSGKDPEIILPEIAATSIQIVNNSIYYMTKAEFVNGFLAYKSWNLHRCNLDGSNDETIIGHQIRDFNILGDYILYSDIENGHTLSIYNLKNKKSTVITTFHHIEPIYDGEYIYCLHANESDWDAGNYQIWKQSLDTKTREKVVDANVSMMMLRGDWIYYINQDDDCRIYRCKKDGTNIELVSQDTNVQSMQWINDRIVYVRVNESGGCEGIYICGPTGYGKITFEYSEDFWDWIID